MITSRYLQDSDKDLLQAWIAAEPDHKFNTPEFYFQDNTKSVLYEDEEGPVFTAKFTPAIRIDIEFSPLAEPKRIGRVMVEEFPKVEEAAKSQGFKEFVFNSSANRLIKFCMRKLKFSECSDYRKVL